MSIRKAVLFALMLLPACTMLPAADPVNLQLTTVIDPISILTINSGSASTPVSVGQATAIPYSYVGNLLVKITVTSLYHMELRHTDWSEAMPMAMPYSMTLDYDGEGPGGQTAVVEGTAVNLYSDNGIYNLNGTFVVHVQDGLYQAGTYTDTLTFSITAQ